MTKEEKQCYLAGYNGKPILPWVPKHAKELRMAYKAGKSDKKAGRPLTLRPGLVFIGGKIGRQEDV